ncbi:hypothetical protein CGRA01v4_01514 [Colletotrichum graminicola]|nr:hypothetical protein CGRA01v4_01514 [Colletotrichum graminicola]
MASHTCNYRTSAQYSGSTDGYVKPRRTHRKSGNRRKGCKCRHVTGDETRPTCVDNATVDHHYSFLEFLLASASASAPSTVGVDGH